MRPSRAKYGLSAAQAFSDLIGRTALNAALRIGTVVLLLSLMAGTDMNSTLSSEQAVMK
jgi:hypothetical protein